MADTKQPHILHDERSLSDEKAKVAQKEYALDSENELSENVDYSGAHEKTDPKEIRLVKKLDLWIMPTLWLMVRQSLILMML